MTYVSLNRDNSNAGKCPWAEHRQFYPAALDLLGHQPCCVYSSWVPEKLENLNEYGSTSLWIFDREKLIYFRKSSIL
jgi:hypothetical protein